MGLGDSVDYLGDADLVFSHLYGPLPPQLIGKPAIINVFGNKREKAEEWCGAALHEVSKWGNGLTNTIYVANRTVPNVDLSAFVEDEFEPGRGWFPEEMVRLLFTWSQIFTDDTVFDGFMGRGTVGKIALDVGFRFVGIDRDPARVDIAREYLNV